MNNSENIHCRSIVEFSILYVIFYIGGTVMEVFAIIYLIKFFVNM